MVVRRIWGYVKGKAKKTIRNYNVIERAEKSLNVDKRAPSPHHKGTDERTQELLKAKPEMKYDSEEPPKELLEMLKKVTVSSDSPLEYSKESSKPLPRRRDAQSVPHFGYEEPTIIPEGKCSLRQALEFIGNFQEDSNKQAIQEISDKYKLRPSDVENVMAHFRAFVVFFEKDSKGNISAMEVLGAQKVAYPKYNIDNLPAEIEIKKIDK